MGGAFSYERGTPVTLGGGANCSLEIFLPNSHKLIFVENRLD